MAPRSPQEKKQLSYGRDRRNIYGENDKASPKNMPRKRAGVLRANRHRAHQDLRSASGGIDASDLAEQRMRGSQPKVRKWPDTPLYVRWKLAGCAQS